MLMAIIGLIGLATIIGIGLWMKADRAPRKKQTAPTIPSSTPSSKESAWRKRLGWTVGIIAAVGLIWFSVSRHQKQGAREWYARAAAQVVRDSVYALEIDSAITLPKPGKNSRDTSIVVTAERNKWSVLYIRPSG